MTVRIGSLELDHPVLNASGTLDPLAAEAAGLTICREVAAIVTKTVTPFAREGNAAPRIAEVTGGMINSIGLQNPGIDSFCEDVLPRLVELGRPIVVSIGGFSLGDYADLAEQLEEQVGVTALELNISCPNVETGCISIGSDVAESEAVVRRVRVRPAAISLRASSSSDTKPRWSAWPGSTHRSVRCWSSIMPTPTGSARSKRAACAPS